MLRNGMYYSRIILPLSCHVTIFLGANNLQATAMRSLEVAVAVSAITCTDDGIKLRTSPTLANTSDRLRFERVAFPKTIIYCTSFSMCADI